MLVKTHEPVIRVWATDRQEQNWGVPRAVYVLGCGQKEAVRIPREQLDDFIAILQECRDDLDALPARNNRNRAGRLVEGIHGSAFDRAYAPSGSDEPVCGAEP